ncbi:MAG: PAS domain S-box protein [Phycisphaerales bacterium]|jgi:PAS domain S-box-containing protein|nr:PAS domain S-box protein [Phycisphaerales bacterium]
MDNTELTREQLEQEVSDLRQQLAELKKEHSSESMPGSEQRALRASEEKFAKAFHASPDSIIISALADGRIIDVNEGFQSISGYSRDEAIGRTSLELNLWTSTEKREKVADILRTQGYVRDMEMNFHRKSGDPFTGLVSIQHIELDAERCLVSVVRDITEHKQTLEELRQHREQLQALTDLAPVAISWANRQGDILYCNNKFRELYGYSLEDIPTLDRWYHLAYPDQEYRKSVIARWETGVDNAIKSGREIAPIEANIVCKNGSTRYVEISGTVLPNRVLAIFNDISDRKQAEEALRSEKDFSNTLIQASPAFIVAIAPDGKTMLMNESMRKELGYSEAEVVGTDYLTTFVPKTDRKDLIKVFQNLNSTTVFTTNENRVLTRDGRKLLVEWRGQQICDSDGHVEYFIGVGIDITERKRAESERDRLEEQLRQAQKMEAVGQLAGGIAHDFNNILTAIQGNAELLKMDIPDTSVQTKFADEIIKGSNRAADLTRQLLAFARKGKWQAVPIDIHDVISQTVSMLTHSIDRRIDIRLELHASPSTITGDPTQLQNTMLNLGVNARDAMPNGGTLTYATRRVTLTQTDCDNHPFDLTPGEFIEICITDTGIGMDNETQQRIFEPFFTTKEVGKGTGLGLAGVYGCILNHEGGISVCSEPGCGASFKILLPLADSKTKTTPETSTENTPIRGTGHILVVEDEESVRNFVAASLNNLGYTVHTCYDGVDGTEYYRRHHSEIDIVILDLIMPKMNGEDTFIEMKKINPNVKAIIASGFSHAQTTNKMLNEGALTLLNKPFNMIKLSQAIAKHIRDNTQKQ